MQTNFIGLASAEGLKIMPKIVSLKMADGATRSKIVPNPDKLSKCPECGQSLNLFATETTDDEWAFEYHVKATVKFCPNCGRKVELEEAADD